MVTCPKEFITFADEDEEFGTVLKLCYQKSDVHNLAKTCFVAEEIEDREDLKMGENDGAIDIPDLEDDVEDGDRILPPEDISS